MSKKSSRFKTLKWTLLTLSLLLVAGIGYYTYVFMSFANSIQAKPHVSSKPLTTQNVSKYVETNLPPKWEGKQRVNVLILGGDSRGLKQNEVPRSDSLIVASIDPVTKKAHLFSIMRDTYVKIPGHGEDRINVAYAVGGPNLAMRTVSDLLGMPIQYYVYTDFKGFIALVDAIGGIEMDVEKDMKYRDSEDGPEYDINLKKGLQHLDGKTALQYVRFRHDALSDFSRTERQRNFIQVVIKKMQTTSSLIKLPWILSSIDPYIETNLSTTDMIKLGSLGYEAKTEGMISQQIPPSELLQEKKIGGADVIGVNRDKLQDFIQTLLGNQDLSSSPPAEVKLNTNRSEAVTPIPLPKPVPASKPAATTPAPSTSKPLSGIADKPASPVSSNPSSKPTSSAASGSSSSTTGKPASSASSNPAAKPTSSAAPGSGGTSKPDSDKADTPAAKPVSDMKTSDTKAPAAATKPVSSPASSGSNSSAPSSKPAPASTGSAAAKPTTSEEKPTSGAAPRAVSETTEPKPVTNR